ncbi:MAG TPA: SCO2522 family protein [Asanoa sp.]|nr:SCO2522 family protein [Asanoa sp.]
MTGVAFEEAVAQRSVERVPLSHLSIELGHLYMEEFAGGIESMRRHFRRVAPWAQSAARTVATRPGGNRPRISTCFLVDDYFSRFSTPREVIPMLVAAAEESGLVIDYLARESGCVVADEVPLARVVEQALVSDPVPGSNGIRPPTTETGWLCNGQRSPNTVAIPAMAEKGWLPPVQNAANRHSIFVDVELWDLENGARRWSCPFLAAVWQLIRLGLLRHNGEVVTTPWQVEEIPDDWDKLPAVVQLNPRAAAFSAYRTFSVLGSRFLEVELAVRTILGQVSIDPTVLDQVFTRMRGEQMELPKELVDRIDYVFIGE